MVGNRAIEHPYASLDGDRDGFELHLVVKLMDTWPGFIASSPIDHRQPRGFGAVTVSDPRLDAGDGCGVPAAENRTVLPDEKLIAESEELERSWRERRRHR
jgi:hypothetical protein